MSGSVAVSRSDTVAAYLDHCRAVARHHFDATKTPPRRAFESGERLDGDYKAYEHILRAVSSSDGWPAFDTEFEVPFGLYVCGVPGWFKIFGPIGTIHDRQGAGRFTLPHVRLGRFTYGEIEIMLEDRTVFGYPVRFRAPVVTPLTGPKRAPFSLPGVPRDVIRAIAEDVVDGSGTDSRDPLFRHGLVLGGIEFTVGHFSYKSGTFTLFDDNRNYQCCLQAYLPSIASGEITWKYDIPNRRKPPHLRFSVRSEPDVRASHATDPSRPREDPALVGYCDRVGMTADEDWRIKDAPLILAERIVVEMMKVETKRKKRRCRR